MFIRSRAAVIAATCILIAVGIVSVQALGAERIDKVYGSNSVKADTVSIDFSNTDIADVLKAIARASGVNIVAGEEIKGKVTARMVDVTVDEALKGVLRSCGYTYVKNGDIIRVVKIPRGFVTVDKKTPQVLIESKIVEVTLDKEDEEGINWNLIASKLNNDLNVSGSVDLNIGDSGLLMNIFNGDAEAIINLINKESHADILSAPKVLALDGSEAKILVGEKVAYQQTFGQVTAGVASSTVEFEDVGIKLYVTPHIQGDEKIALDVFVEVSSVKEWRTISNGDEIPIISTKQADSRVIVKNNSTVIIGGLIGEERVKSLWKVPILGDIPLVKYLFRRTHFNKSKKELTIFITPKIANADVAANEKDTDEH